MPPKPAAPAKKPSPASHFGLASRVRKLVLGEKIAPLPNAYDLMLSQDGESRLPSGTLVGKGHGQTTANYTTMAIVVELVRLWRGGAPPAWIPAAEAAAYLAFCRQRALDLLKEELTDGLMRGEQLAVAPHDELHLAPMALLRIGASEVGDAEILNALDEWWRRYLDVCAACSTPNGVLCHAGARSRGEPTSEVGSAILAEVTKNVPLREPGKVSTALTAVRSLLAAGDTFGGARRETPDPGFAEAAMRRLGRVKLRYPMVVERYADRVRSYVPKPAPKFWLRELFASFVEVRFGKERNANQLLKAGKLTVVKGWSEEPPAAPGKPLLRAITA